MLYNRLPIACFLLIHTLTLNANASLSLDLEGIKTLPLHVNHKKHPLMRNLGYLKLSIFDGDDFHHYEAMNVHSPRRVLDRHEDRFSIPHKTSPRDRTYSPVIYDPPTYEKTYQIRKANISNGDALMVTFLQEEVMGYNYYEKENHRYVRTYRNPAWQGLEDIPVADLGLIDLETCDGILEHLTLDIIWESLSEEQPKITFKPYYR